MTAKTPGTSITLLMSTNKLASVGVIATAPLNVDTHIADERKADDKAAYTGGGRMKATVEPSFPNVHASVIHRGRQNRNGDTPWPRLFG